jgi:hypothetical protein
MSVLDVPRLDLAELGQLLEAADPAALLVPPRVLRRVIKRDRHLSGLGLQVPHRKSYVIGQGALLALAGRDELGIGPGRELPPVLMLIVRPEPEELAELPRGEALVKYWRLLFHARVHLAVARGLTDAAVRERVHRIGQAEFDEARAVLRQEHYLVPPGDDRTAYEEFAAVYLELRFFAGSLLPRYFSSVEDFGRIDRILARDLDGAALFAATRLAGAPDPPSTGEESDEEEPGLEPVGAPTVPGAPSEERYRELLARADRAAAAGNAVRAAIRRKQAARVAPAELAGEVRARARAELDGLVTRLQQALDAGEPGTTRFAPEAWRQALAALLPGAARGVWPAEARLLYDLQKICVDHERPVYSLDPVEWLYSGFRQPFVRPLPNQSLVLAVKHLRRAVGRLPSVRVADAERRLLSELLHGALHHAEVRLRERFRPLVHESLDAVGLRPQNFPERVSRDKLVEELLDRVTEHGFLNMGDLRDALARNQLKLPDLAGPGEFFRGDPLIRANRELADRAAGVYRRGEIYLRWLQRGTALAFGTRPGRWFTLFLALPFIGAFATVVFAQEILHLLRLPHHLEPGPLGVTVGVLGVFYLLLLHLPAFRGLVLHGLRLAWAGVRTVVIDVPAAVLRLPPVRRLLGRLPFQLLIRYVLEPLPFAILTWVVVWLYRVGPGLATLAGVATFLGVSLFLNSPAGRDLEEIATDWAARRWARWRGLLPGLFHLVMDVFERLLEALDRFLYAVDEWLRFRRGQGRLTLVFKTVVGSVWLVVAYVVRLYVNVFIEPTVNPIKHFPAVTVAAKLLVPFWIPLTELFATPLLFLGRPLAYSIAFFGVHTLAGAGGFLVWELKENWRLYRANRPATLRPAVIGHHGETMARLLRPGFHSGTLPKLYAKLRRAERKAHRGGTWRRPRKLREALHEAEDSVRRFAERELAAYLNGSRGWAAGPVHLAAVEAGSNRLRLELACPSLGGPGLELKFEELSGWLLARIGRPGWLPRLSPGQAAVLATALTGFYPRSCVDLVREQIETCFAPHCPPYDVRAPGLIVWPGPGYETEMVYDLRAEGPVLRPRVVAGRPPADLPVLEADDILFSRRAVAWQDWVEVWERDQAGEGPGKPLLPGVRVLPGTVCSSADSSAVPG